MVKKFARNAAVKLFALMTRLGIQRVPLFTRVFLALYSLYKGYFEAGPIGGLEEFAPPGSLVIDVGANVGFFTVRFAGWVGQDGMVIAIEPEDQNHQHLLTTLARAGLLGRVTALKAVAAGEYGTMFLELNPLHPADHKLSLNGIGIPVPAVNIDGLMRDNPDYKLTLVKIDVQGAEMLVLEGSRETLRRVRPALFVELHEEGLGKFGTSISAILEYLSGYGYLPYWLSSKGSHRKADTEEIHARATQHGYVDVLFLPVAAR
jgi:FkbM family methyltransferase